MHCINVGKERMREGPVRRFNHDQLHLPFWIEMLLQTLPLGTYHLNLVRINRHMHSSNMR